MQQSSSSPNFLQRLLGAPYSPTFGLMDGYLLGQLLFYFVMAVLSLTVTFLFSDALLDLLFDLQQFGFPLHVGLTLITLELPRIIALSLPMAAVLAALLTYMQLNQRLEIVPIRMAGVSLYRLARPALMLGVFVAVLLFWLNNFLAPQSSLLMRTIRVLAMAEYVVPHNQHHFVFRQFDPSKQQLQRLLYVNRIKEKQLNGVIVLDLTRPGTLQMTQARQGKWTGDQVVLDHAGIYTLTATGKLMNTSQASHLVLSNFLELPSLDVDVKVRHQSLVTLLKQIKTQKAQSRVVPTELWMITFSKIIFPFAVIPLVVLTIPLTLQSPRQKHHWGVILAILATFGYYLLDHSAGQLVGVVALPPLVIALIPIVLLSLGVWILFEQKQNHLAVG